MSRHSSSNHALYKLIDFPQFSQQDGCWFLSSQFIIPPLSTLHSNYISSFGRNTSIMVSGRRDKQTKESPLPHILCHQWSSFSSPSTLQLSEKGRIQVEPFSTIFIIIILIISIVFLRSERHRPKSLSMSATNNLNSIFNKSWSYQTWQEEQTGKTGKTKDPSSSATNNLLFPVPLNLISTWHLLLFTF